MDLCDSLVKKWSHDRLLLLLTALEEKSSLRLDGS